MSENALKHPREVWGLRPDWVQPELWEMPLVRLSPDRFHFQELGDELCGLLATEEPFISSEGSFLAFAYLHETGEKLAWRVMLVSAGQEPDMPGAYAWVRVSMKIKDRFLVEAYHAERKRQRRRATLSLPEEDRERCAGRGRRHYVGVLRSRNTSYPPQSVCIERSDIDGGNDPDCLVPTVIDAEY